ncbi:hypothetical protein SAMN05421788_103530 [Filimonas lacunae]|uniref:CarboxypepD_reg-like domain-containing protein n=1 Tax=Filimonas lacunae TaxID=477680 RepID=A0A173MKR0_9BACT|nr:carboxypeptidase-like regulatory domain-containing protein [Filimonas lacunae]BAV08194.1 hypothetical protein FLA_4227 [Filimonas lacunae]SIT10634.1 hypothetical protein SAMN05421788_103530 [Filimonas lacunae]
MRNLLIQTTAVIVVLFAIISPSFSQNGVVVSGVINNSNTGEKVSAVSVTIKGTKTGTYTNDRGFFH